MSVPEAPELRFAGSQRPRPIHELRRASNALGRSRLRPSKTADRRAATRARRAGYRSSSLTDPREREIIRINEALDELAKIDERMVKVVEMRYFAGMTEDEVAEALGVSKRSVARDWEKARLFLAANLD
jgi:RNA polymerase sigma factor (sigma-70 family)